MKIDVVICTYNRPEKIIQLVNELLSASPSPDNIIVVDSSDQDNIDLAACTEVTYVKSNHKNQPYQRYLGHSQSKAEFLLYLDDDMELIEKRFFSEIKDLLEAKGLSGIALNFIDKHDDTSLAQVPKSKLFTFSKSISALKNWLTGYRNLPEGKFGLCGNRGKQPSELGKTEYLSGGAFIAKRELLFSNFNFQLFDLFENRMGMGEDALIGYGLSKRGKLLYRPDISFLHNDQKNSTYAADITALAKRVLFSRLYLSLEKRRLDQESILTSKIHYHYYSFWRLTGLLVNRLMKPTENRKKTLTGSIQGWKTALSFKFHNELESNDYWELELKKNIQNIG